MNFIRNGFIEIELRNELMRVTRSGISADLEVNVDGPTFVPTRINREEFGNPVRIRYLVAAQKLFTPRIESSVDVPNIGIGAERVAVPYIDHGAA